ncbi:hypothetical protein WR25_17936 [Diploscapter pachys]|uniref:Secreted protein n=1 Tax=Diploscapter pachys TaxID=2018661 RepID=A0A2A2M3G3_9BILA|nr:hypothetical protein WR25_17936 [Diploscapter pachys]
MSATIAARCCAGVWCARALASMVSISTPATGRGAQPASVRAERTRARDERRRIAAASTVSRAAATKLSFMFGGRDDMG